MMWWTQPKLAFITVAGNALISGVVVLGVRTPALQLTLLVVTQLLLLAVYALAAQQLAAQHLSGATEAAFDRHLWSRPWRPAVDRTFLPKNAMPRDDGASFYRQVLGDNERSRRSLYVALATWEGTRLEWRGSTAGVAAALGSSTVMAATVPWTGLRPWQVALAALVVPLWLLVLPEAANVLLLRRAMLRHGPVQRVAVLVPRDAADLGLRDPDQSAELGRDGAVAMFVALGIPVALLISLAAGLGWLLISAVLFGVVAGILVVSVRAFRRLLVDTIPFLRFDGPVEVSILLDLVHRQRGHLSLYAAVGSLHPLLFFVMLLEAPLLALQTLIAVGYLVVITFGDQFSGYAGFGGATRFEQCFKRCLGKMEAGAP